MRIYKPCILSASNFLQYTITFYRTRERMPWRSPVRYIKKISLNNSLDKWSQALFIPFRFYCSVFNTPDILISRVMRDGRLDHLDFCFRWLKPPAIKTSPLRGLDRGAYSSDSLERSRSGVYNPDSPEGNGKLAGGFNHRSDIPP